MRDPLAAGKLAANQGGAALQRGNDARWELADVIAYNSKTHTAVVRTHTGRPLPNVPRIKTGPGDFENLRQGTTVVIAYDVGFPAILGTIDMVGPPQAAIASPTLTAVPGVGDDNPLQPTEGSNTYRPPNAPTDMTQGDWARVGGLGQHVAVLEGGIAQLGSPSALVRSLGAIGLLQFIGQRMKAVTDFGEWSVTNDQGRTSFVLRAGYDQSTQTGLDEQHWTIRLDLGASGDIFNFQITDPVGKTLFKIFAGSDGRVQIYGDGGVDVSSGKSGDAETLHEIAGDRGNSVGGDDSLSIAGDRSIKVGKSLVENVTTDRTVAVGNDDTLFVNKDQAASVGGNKVEVVAGGAAQDAKKGQTALSLKVLNGGYVIDIGNPDDGASLTAEAAYDLRTSIGDVSVSAGGNLKLKAKQTASLDGQVVQINGDTYFMLKTTDALQDLGQYMTLNNAVLQAGTAGSPVKQQLVGLPAVTAQLQQIAQKFTQGQPYLSRKAKNG